MELRPHQQRVVDEAKELADKIEKLTTFMVGEMFATLEDEEEEVCELMERQRMIMVHYLSALQARIARFHGASA